MEIDGAEVRRLRLARVMTLRQLAELADMSYTNLSRLERNRQRAHQATIHKLARALGVKPAKLLKTAESRDAN